MSFEKLLHRMRGKVRGQDYLMTLHAEEEMDAEDLSVFDVESVILTGQIVERQRDRVTGERKYILRGSTIAGDGALVVAKLSPTGKLVILTVYGDK